MRAAKLNMIILGTVSAFFLSACGGGSAPKNTEKLIASCASGSTTLKKGDKVIALENNTEVKVLHEANGIKTVCVSKGKAAYQ